ncbi:hypothetical protein [Viridibacillus arvi]|uniref:hypothetical protein n=1 Tax=Viridibacillus arvi TaxID=263475 RepID=UPI003D2B3D8E
MSKRLQQIIEEIKKEMDLKYESEREELKKIYENLTDGQFYAGKCLEASKFALEILNREGYSDYKLGSCFVGTISHWVLYKEEKNGALIGVIDMTANQFLDPNQAEMEDYVICYEEEFKRFSYGLISNEHSLKHYKTKRTN